MRKLVLAMLSLAVMHQAAIAGPKEDAFQVIEQFKRAFDASDVEGVVKLFAPDAIFLGTVSPNDRGDRSIFPILEAVHAALNRDRRTFSRSDIRKCRPIRRI
jgi:ketosteroid isomerase-like protein